MYQKYQTDALILGGRERGEADRFFALYTREFGLVWAKGSGVRKEVSRMRYALQSSAYVQIGLVRGKRGWRVAGAHAIRQQGSTKGAATFTRISSLVLRLIHGQEQNPYLFEALAEAHAALAAGDGESIATIEIVCVARVLYALGYLSVEALGSTLFTHTAYGVEHIVEAEKKRVTLLASINKALSETQL